MASMTHGAFQNAVPRLPFAPRDTPRSSSRPNSVIADSLPGTETTTRSISPSSWTWKKMVDSCASDCSTTTLSKKSTGYWPLSARFSKLDDVHRSLAQRHPVSKYHHIDQSCHHRDRNPAI